MRRHGRHVRRAEVDIAALVRSIATAVRSEAGERARGEESKPLREAMPDTAHRLGRAARRGVRGGRRGARLRSEVSAQTRARRVPRRTRDCADSLVRDRACSLPCAKNTLENRRAAHENTQIDRLVIPLPVLWPHVRRSAVPVTACNHRRMLGRPPLRACRLVGPH